MAVCGKKGIFAVFRKRNNQTMLLSVIETAETLGCSAQYVRKLLREGRLAGQKIGDSWIINDDTLESFDRKDLRMKKNDVPDRKSKKAPKQDALNCLSFFSGAMGLDIGLEQEGINILLACETDNACRRTIVANEPGIGLIGDIRDYTVGEILEYANLRENGQVDIVVGGPPCQAFSTAGKRLGFQDERGNVFLKYIEVIREIQPQYAVIENVRGLFSSALSIDIDDEITRSYDLDWAKTPGSTLFYIKKKLEAAGYNVTFNLYNSANFGSPQIRERVVITCTKSPNPVPYLRPTHSNEEVFGLERWRTFRDAVAGLDPARCDHIDFSEKRLKYIKMLKPAESAQRTPAGSHGKLLPSGRWENGLLPKAGLGFAVPHGSHPSRHARNGIGAPDGKQAPVHTRIQKDSGISRRLGDRRQFAGQIQTNRQCGSRRAGQGNRQDNRRPPPGSRNGGTGRLSLFPLQGHIGS